MRRLNDEKFILQQYKERIEKELREAGSNSLDSYVNRFRQVEFDLGESVKKIKDYESRIVEYEKKVTLLSTQLTVKNSEI